MITQNFDHYAFLTKRIMDVSIMDILNQTLRFRQEQLWFWRQLDLCNGNINVYSYFWFSTCDLTFYACSWHFSWICFWTSSPSMDIWTCLAQTRACNLIRACIHLEVNFVCTVFICSCARSGSLVLLFIHPTARRRFQKSTHIFVHE